MSLLIKHNTLRFRGEQNHKILSSDKTHQSGAKSQSFRGFSLSPSSGSSLMVRTEITQGLHQIRPITPGVYEYNISLQIFAVVVFVYVCVWLWLSVKKCRMLKIICFVKHCSCHLKGEYVSWASFRSLTQDRNALTLNYSCENLRTSVTVVILPKLFLNSYTTLLKCTAHF